MATVGCRSNIVQAIEYVLKHLKGLTTNIYIKQ